jgi:DNA-directed RNA polymerase subunit alpha
VGSVTDFDKLTLEVWTNGTINARGRGLAGREDPLRPFCALYRPFRERGQQVHRRGEAEAQRDKVLEMTIEELDLSVRSFNCLKRANITIVEDLIPRPMTR